MRTPVKVSVLVPIYNVEKYLKQCLDSLAAQTFTDYEVICINDGSTDSSRNIIETFITKYHNFRCINKTNSGYGDSMNQGLDAACGEYIAILESDDFAEPQMLSDMYRTAKKHNAQVVKANFNFFWSAPTPKNEFSEMFPENLCDRVIHPVSDLGIFSKQPSIWSAIYNREFLQQHNIRFLDTPGASFQDTSFTFKVWACASRVVYLHQPYVHYRQDNENSSINSLGKVDAIFREYDEITSWLAEKPQEHSLFSAMKAKMLFDAAMWSYHRVGDEHKLIALDLTRKAMLAEQKAGTLDIRLFDQLNLKSLHTLLKSPEDFHAMQDAKIRNYLHKVVWHFQQGGLKSVVRIVSRKLLGRKR